MWWPWLYLTFNNPAHLEHIVFNFFEFEIKLLRDMVAVAFNIRIHSASLESKSIPLNIMRLR